MPDSVLTPAPVSTTQGPRASSSSTSRRTVMPRIVELAGGRLYLPNDGCVRFADTDAQGIAHNASYLVWYEVARVEYLREYAGGYQALRDLGIEALVLESFCRYVVP